MRIRWTKVAAADMQAISDYLREHHPHYPQPIMRNLYQRLRELKSAPCIGRPGGNIEILRIYHGAQDRP